MKWAEQFFKVIDRIAGALAAFCIAGMLFCVFLQVVARMTGLKVNWTTELSQYFFLWSTTFGGYLIARRKKMIGVELIQKSMPAPLRRLMKFTAWLSGAAFYFILIWYCLPRLPRLMNQTTPVLKWPMGVIYIVMLLGVGVMALYFVYLAFIGLCGADEKKPQAPKDIGKIVEEAE
ncbi:MAG: TRAP transporter small permease [Pyramidobacter sp.]|jgi:TRAP-type C4-dicarboxylate transport system permease small subunit